ncbi:PH domain-containing protein [Desmospora activa]|uniref:PH (Pleckstrin Homology) domain-containing protein n=1 Tax=Desmospora activa DSM 45169 TaxID=1121389 RepID=A0A2T4ZBB3_9BACL|nr:PH domain-containing protein [Desmospora activa]PTM59179.1 PH (Pleckstrin Homology) domain-containing protein [Desmospora activa DSM 45169]
MQEETLWEGSPSHVAVLGTYLLCLLLCVLIVPIFYAIWVGIKLKSTRYRLTTERLQITTGILSKKTEVVELYRVKDMTLEQPFFLRLFSRGKIRLITSDQTMPQVHLEAIADANELMDVLRKHVEERRDQKRVREVDGLG